ncbi:MAG TPA: hypothetical protein VIW26_13330 [Gemmatimonadales bacterium]
MCDRSMRALTASLLLFATPLAGQIPALRARADSLLTEWRQAKQFADLQDSLRLAGERGGRDTIRVGALVYLVNRSPLLLREAAAIAWPQLERFYGPAAQAFAQRPFLIQAVDPDTNEFVPPGQAIKILWNTEVAPLSRALVAMADLGDLDPALRDWLGGAVVARFDSGPAHAAVYVQLVTVPSRAVQRCYGGDRRACSDALSLSEMTDPADRWYGPGERRHLVVTQYGDFLNRSGHAQAVDSCERGSDASCLELLRSLAPGALSRPLDYQARLTLLETAIRLGGAETFQRFLATPTGPMGRRLATAARVSEDSLVGRWRSDVLAARPTPVPLPPWGAWVALGWVIVFGTCGLRSSRWRVS